MENYEGNVGFDLSKMPLSNIAQRIMAAMHSFDLEENKNFRENEKNEKIGHYSSMKDTLLENKSPHCITVTDQPPKASSIISLQSTGILHSNQMSNIKDPNSSGSLPLSSCVYTPLHFKPSHLQKNGNKKEYLLKENTNIEKKETKNLKRKHATASHMSEQAKNCFTMEEFGIGIETKYKNSGETKSLENPVCDVRHLGPVEKRQLIEILKQATTLVVTMIYQDGPFQLKHDEDLNSMVKGIIILIKSPLDTRNHPFCASTTDPPVMDEFSIDDRYIYIKVEHDTLWRQEQEMSNQFARTMLFQILKCKHTVICFNAKEFVKTVLQVYGSYCHWKHVVDFVVLDPRIAAWLLDPSDTISSFEDLVRKYFEESVTMKVNNTNGGSSHNMMSLCSDLRILYRITVDLCSKLKVCGLWQLFYTLELPLIPILAVMETHKFQVDKEEMKRTSKLLGCHLKELEQEAHVAAGEQFLVTSNNQLREVLFDKLKLHLLCKSKTLPKTELQKHPSTSEAVLNALQDLHPLPKIILEYRQIHKVKSTFVDGLLSCMRKGFIAPTWNQTGTVSGRLSAKKPNIQGISKHPIQITKHQYEQGKEDEKTTVSPRTMFISSKGYTFLAADFSQIELRILAHLSCDPELLKLFQEPESLDVFMSLTSQWKGIPLEQVTHVEREQTKRIVYSVVYGAGKERLAACLGVTSLQSSQFIESFLQKYKKIHDFTQETIMQCHHKGYVTSIMGRRRPLPNINAKDYRLRTQAERQAVNFVVQGSAADLCKIAMIRIFTSIATSPKLTARLLAQIHDELLFEVEDSQIPEFAALVKETMESLQNIQAIGLCLKVPLKVNLATGRSWGCLRPFPEAAPGAARPWPAGVGH
ncbi:DNA polymerase nu isoform X1 [Monodelphis domestica]|uniref:DNA polymerase nu isoform X1 n=1 Tax=Monodelphis domestica TaxID=13616 RepID=UPI0024E23354|nr:DNA polymerase nu isoform X1 [Monodelphis domestica]XP_056658293.1 DNA polymerase nu isoform X1 [Monodelphis domestica]